MSRSDVSLFDTYIVVDWSARNSPATGADSIWIAVGDGDGAPVLANPPTRALAERMLRDVVTTRATSRVLLGIDVSLGYPVGTADLFGLDGTPWRAIWNEVTSLLRDDESNRNNRFEVASMLNRRAGGGPFWGCPPSQRFDSLPATKPRGVLEVAEFRECERRLRLSGSSPKSGWQLLGVGSVGSQSLTAIPMLSRLLAAEPDRVDVWPFTTGCRTPNNAPGRVVVAEVWPTMFAVPDVIGEVRDATQVRGVAGALAAADANGELARWFAPDVPDASTGGAIVAEEGWILGPSTRLDQD